jgi:transposase
MTIIRIGIDLAKNSFSLCGVYGREQVVLEKTVKRGGLLSVFTNLPPCMVAMDAGSGAHHWARELIKLGFDARIMDPAFVAPYRTGGRSSKNDRNDAWAICEAAVSALRPNQVARPAGRIARPRHHKGDGGIIY